MSKDSVPGSPPLYLKKVDSGGQPNNPRCSSLLKFQACATLKNVRIAGPDIRRRTAGSRRPSSETGSCSRKPLTALGIAPSLALVHICSIRPRSVAPLPFSAAILKTKAFPVTTSSNPTLVDESELVSRAQAGEDEAFAELVARYQNKIHRLAKNITQNNEDAEDVLQETFLKAYSHLAGFQRNSRFYTWIVRIAVNEALMKLRKRRNDRTVPLDEPVDTGEEAVTREIAVWEDNPEQRYSREEMQQILDEAVEDLKPDFRTVFALRDIEELSTEETAEALGISVPAVKSRLLRARLALREKLTRQFKRKGEDVFRSEERR